MSVLINAMIEHNLSPEEILNFPEVLRASLPDQRIWKWTSGQMSVDALLNSWNKGKEHFTSGDWSWNDFAILRNEDLTIDFMKPNLVLVNDLSRYSSYFANSEFRFYFNELIEKIANCLKAIDVILVPDLSGVEFFDEDEDWTIQKYRQLDLDRSYHIEFTIRNS